MYEKEELLELEKKWQDIPDNTNKDICSKCISCCCTHNPCELYPIDVINRYGKITEDTITKLIDEGWVSIDSWEGDARPNKNELLDTFFLRPKIEGADVPDFAYSGKCSLLTETGCSLIWDARPLGAKILVPYLDENGYADCNYPDDIIEASRKCGYINGKQLACIHWFPYQDILGKIASRYPGVYREPISPTKFDSIIEGIVGIPGTD